MPEFALPEGFRPRQGSRGAPSDSRVGFSSIRVLAFWLSLGLIFTTPTQDMLGLPGVGSFNRGLGLVAFAVWLASAIAVGRFRRLGPVHIPIGLFLLWNFASVVWTVDPEATQLRIWTFVQTAGFLWILWDLYTTERHLRRALQVYVLGAYVALASLLWNYLQDTEREPGRFTPVGTDPNEASLLLTLALPVAWYLAIHSARRVRPWLGLLNYAYVPIAALAIVLTGSRTGVLCSLPVGVYLLGASRSWSLPTRFSLVAALGLALLVLQPLVPEQTLQRLGTTRAQIEDADLGGRVRLWRAGMNAFPERPIIGFGSGTYRVSSRTGRSAHNTLLSLLVDLGIIGVALFVAVIVTTVHQALAQPRPRRRLFLTLGVVWLLSSLTHNMEQTRHTWLVMFLPIIGAQLAPLRCGRAATRGDAPDGAGRLRRERGDAADSPWGSAEGEASPTSSGGTGTGAQRHSRGPGDRR